MPQKFAINDRYFASVLGPTFPNRSYLLAATSFGHVTTADEFPPPGGRKKRDWEVRERIEIVLRGGELDMTTTFESNARIRLMIGTFSAEASNPVQQNTAIRLHVGDMGGEFSSLGQQRSRLVIADDSLNDRLARYRQIKIRKGG